MNIIRAFVALGVVFLLSLVGVPRAQASVPATGPGSSCVSSIDEVTTVMLNSDTGVLSRPNGVTARWKCYVSGALATMPSNGLTFTFALNTLSPTYQKAANVGGCASFHVDTIATQVESLGVDAGGNQLWWFEVIAFGLRDCAGGDSLMKAVGPISPQYLGASYGGPTTMVAVGAESYAAATPPFHYGTEYVPQALNGCDALQVSYLGQGVAGSVDHRWLVSIVGGSPGTASWRYSIPVEEYWSAWTDVVLGATDPPLIVHTPGTSDAGASGELRVVSASNVEWRCQKNGETVPLDTGNTQVVVAESCYALGSLSLTSPKTWVAAAGRMGVCLVRAAVVPSNAERWLAEQKFKLAEKPPVSFVSAAYTFVDSVSDPNGQGNSCVGTVSLPGGPSNELCIVDPTVSAAVESNGVLQVVLWWSLIGSSILLVAVSSLAMLR